MRAGLALKMNHEFSLSDLPTELAAVLRDYDVDNSGSVSVAELVAGAQLMRQQAKKVRGPSSRFRFFTAASQSAVLPADIPCAPTCRAPARAEQADVQDFVCAVGAAAFAPGSTGGSRPGHAYRAGSRPGPPNGPIFRLEA